MKLQGIKTSQALEKSSAESSRKKREVDQKHDISLNSLLREPKAFDSIGDLRISSNNLFYEASESRSSSNGRIDNLLSSLTNSLAQRIIASSELNYASNLINSLPSNFMRGAETPVSPQLPMNYLFQGFPTQQWISAYQSAYNPYWYSYEQNNPPMSSDSLYSSVVSQNQEPLGNSPRSTVDEVFVDHRQMNRFSQTRD